MKEICARFTDNITMLVASSIGFEKSDKRDESDSVMDLTLNMLYLNNFWIQSVLLGLLTGQPESYMYKFRYV